jgi:dTMP kinase
MGPSGSAATPASLRARRHTHGIVLAIGSDATALDGATGRFLSFEGVDGSGKSTQVRHLAGFLRDRGVEVVEVREPGGTEAGERIRAVVLDPESTLTPESEALLFAAARAQVVAEVIEPALARGATVIADRFVDSSLVYQGIVRGVGLEAVRSINAFATGGRLPDRTIWLDVPVDEAIVRGGSERDRIEREGAAFHGAVNDAYATLAQADAARIVRVLGDGAPDEVAARVREAIGV